jgi:hypothetical protein
MDEDSENRILKRKTGKAADYDGTKENYLFISDRRFFMDHSSY